MSDSHVRSGGDLAHGGGRSSIDLVPRTALPCVICGHGGRGVSVQWHLTHGLSVWLCPVHRSAAYLRRRSGRVFVDRLTRVWGSAGALTVRKAALASHMRRVRDAIKAPTCPGSYSWPMLRREAERRFAAGEPPDRVIADLRANYRDGPAMVPSVRTMRRWFTDARWLVERLVAERPGGGEARWWYGGHTDWRPLVNVMISGSPYVPRSVPLWPRLRGP